MLEENNTFTEENYPAVDLAYEVSLKSYDWAIQRMDSIDNTIDKLLAWISSINLGVIAIVASKTSNISGYRNLSELFESGYFYTSMVIFFIIILLGVITKIFGSLRLVSPKKLLSRLHKNHWLFKKDAIYLSANDFRINQIIVNRKGYISITIIVLFIFEIYFLIGWLIFPN